MYCRVVLRRRDVPENMCALSYGLKLISMALGASALGPGSFVPGGGIITVGLVTGKGSSALPLSIVDKPLEGPWLLGAGAVEYSVQPDTRHVRSCQNYRKRHRGQALICAFQALCREQDP